ncbi:trypsin-like peptidase domain-containing protein [Waterburya agarophytonicola K14]|uniref:Trypsin-like peptidase domain-containing protein n=1 Tax=Waterburya agarophytonicola KI4 TaxID=2874699 RepID=A0A964FGG0_9CYAN|nr:serine protease [Waterburya agarophytonicola]MCC0177971.1 trypsin-like peptidase domain-containing protein [Waterburya agarophytonicola KI4]
MNKWINQKFISAAISGIAITIVGMVGINSQKAIALPAATVNQIVKKSTVRIDGAGNGSGVIIAEDDYGYVVLTNQHVVEVSGEYQVVTADGKSHPATDIQQLEGADLALVYFDTDRRYSIVAQGNSDTLIEGQKIHIAGYPGSQQIASNRTYRFMSESLIGFLAPSDVKDGYELIYSGEAVPGMSGSPILNEEAQLIGVYGLTDIDFTTGTSYLYGIPLNTALKIATRSGIELDLPKTVSNQSNSVIDLFSPSPGNSVNTNNNNGNVGFEVIGNAAVNDFIIPEIIYTGECPGNKLESQEAMFFSTTTATAPDRRVLITNVTRGLSRDPLPFADREYEEGQVSEKTKVTIGSKHDKRNFVLLAGKNQFKYEIVQIEEDDDFETVLEEGTFTATAKKEPRYVERSKVAQEEIYCPDDQKYCDREQQKVRTVYKCPIETKGLFGYNPVKNPSM